MILFALACLAVSACSLVQPKGGAGSGGSSSAENATAFTPSSDARKDLGDALASWRGVTNGTGPVVLSERGCAMTPLSIVVWFARAYRAVGLEGCSSHSGRRTFITRAARLVHKAGGSLRDVQLLAGHRSIQTTQRYIDGDTDAQRKLVSLI